MTMTVCISNSKSVLHNLVRKIFNANEMRPHYSDLYFSVIYFLGQLQLYRLQAADKQCNQI